MNSYEDLPAYILCRDILDTFGFSAAEVFTDTVQLKDQRLRLGKQMVKDLENKMIPDYA